MRRIIFMGITACIITTIALVSSFGDEAKKTVEKAKGHYAVHGGCLNALGTCEIGHVEVKLSGATMKLWFVGGVNDTRNAVRVPDKEIVLSVTLDGQNEAKTIILKAKPIEDNGEKEGDCSCFKGSASWLKGVSKLTAKGTVQFKGKTQSIVIEWPNGYEPD